MKTPVSLFTSDQQLSQPPEPVQQPVSDEVRPATVVEKPMLNQTAHVMADQAVEAEVSSRLEALAAKAVTCRLCKLEQTRSNVVFGVGNPNADLVFIGEAPGRDEDLKGEPFVGRAGQLLDRMLTAVGLDRDQVYIMNTIKCRPPNNRDPKTDEVQACNLWFEQQLEALQPKMICLLGRVAAQTVLGSDAPLGSMRGHWHHYQGIPVWVTYHPAYLLRSPQQKQKSWLDLLAVKQRLAEVTSQV